MGKFSWEEKEKVELPSFRGMEISQEDSSEEYQSEELSERRILESGENPGSVPVAPSADAPAETPSEEPAEGEAEGTAQDPGEDNSAASGKATAVAPDMAPVQRRTEVPAATEKKRHISVLGVGVAVLIGVAILGVMLIMGLAIAEKEAELERLNAELELWENREELPEGDFAIEIPSDRVDTGELAMVCDAVRAHGQCGGLVAAMDYSINFEGHKLDLILLEVDSSPFLEDSAGVVADFVLIDKTMGQVINYSNYHFPEDVNISPQTHEAAVDIIYWAFSCRPTEAVWDSQIWADFEYRRNWEQAEIDAVNSILAGNPPDAEFVQLPEVEFSGNAWQLQAQISTIEEVAAFMDTRFPELMMSAHLTNDSVDYCWLAPGEEIVMRSPDECVGRGCIVNAATFLLCDNMEIYTVIGFRHDQYNGIPMMAINCIKTDEGYRFVDPVRMMRGDAMSRCGALLPEATVGSIEEYIELICADREIYNTLEYLYFFENGERFEFYEHYSGCVRLKSPDREPVYHNPSLTVTMEEYQAKKFAHVKPENIGNYQLSRLLGGTTLTVEEALALADAEPEVVKEQVKTAADVLMYMLAARIGDNGGCYCDNWGGYTWHSNYTAKTVMEQKLSNCGASANLANYLLEGDYEEIGFINHAYYPGNGGGHVYNYIKYQGSYYIVDYSWYIFANYETWNDFPVMKLGSLEEFGYRVHEIYGGVSLVIAYTSPGQHLPNIFGEEYGEPYYYVPEGAQYAVLYQSGDGYLIAEKYLDPRYHDWTVFWE